MRKLAYKFYPMLLMEFYRSNKNFNKFAYITINSLTAFFINIKIKLS